MNAPLLDHPFRLVESVYNNIRLDCSRIKSVTSNDSCHKCLEETRNARGHLQHAIYEMLQVEFEEYKDRCMWYIYESNRFSKATETLSPTYICHLDDHVANLTVRTLRSCLGSSLKQADVFKGTRLDNLFSALTEAFALPHCKQAEILESVKRDCGESDQAGDKDCLSILEEIRLKVDYSAVFCHAYGILRTFVRRGPADEFRPGVLMKHWRSRQPQYYIQDCDVLKSLTTIDKGDFSIQCYDRVIMQRDLHHCRDFTPDVEWFDDMHIAYKLFKQRIPPPSKVAVEKGELMDSERIKTVLQTDYSYKMKNNPILNDYAAILACKFGNRDELTEDCNAFSLSFASTGIGYTFNAQPFELMFKNTTSNFAFYKEMHEKHIRFTNDKTLAISNSGQTFLLEFVIRHEPYGYQQQGENQDGQYQELYLTIHDPSHVSNLRSEGILIRPGMDYEMRITPTLATTDNSAMSLNNATRNCLSKRENSKLAAFNIYSKSACVLECKLRHAVSKCNCSAWDYPKVDQEADVCLGKDSHQCFHAVMERSTVGTDCDCLTDCEQVMYDFDVQVSALQHTGKDLKQMYACKKIELNAHRQILN